MSPDLDWIETVFLAARRLPLAEREALLEQKCGSNQQARRQIESLLEADQAPCALLDGDCVEFGRLAIAAELDSSTVANPPPSGVDAQASVRIGRYRILSALGEGGMGIVYEAEQESPRRRVALKIIKQGMDTRRVVARFEAERQALALMDHPHIARVFDGGSTEAGRSFFAMELVRGVPITRFCDDQRLTLRQRLELFQDVCHAVQHAHAKGVIHRDIKPSNILVAQDDGRPVAKVIDFGIAKAIHQPLTEATMLTDFHQFVGTPAYMSPEQARLGGLDLDTRSDIYALGVLLYELLCGVAPFDAQRLRTVGFEEMLRIIREEEPPRPSSRLNERAARETASRQGFEPSTWSRALRGDLDWITMKCLEKDRNRRYKTADGLGLDIQRYLNDEPISAGPPTTVYKLRKLVRRNRGMVAAAMAVVLALTGGMGTALWQAHCARREAAKAGAVSAFLLQTLATADPFDEIIGSMSQGLGPIARDRTVLAVVDQAAEDLDAGEFAGDPLTESAMRFNIGKVYLSLGQMNQADRQLRCAYKLRLRLLGRNDRETLVALVELVRATNGPPSPPGAPPDDASELLELALAVVPQVLGPEDRSTQALMASEAQALRSKFRDDLAADKLSELLALQRRVLPECDPQTLGVMCQLSAALSASNQASEGRSLARQALDLAFHCHGDDHVVTNLARMYFVYANLNLRTDEDLALIRKAAAGLRNHLGNDHTYALAARRFLAEVLTELREFDEAEQIARDVLADYIRVQGEGADGTAIARGRVAEILWKSAMKLPDAARMRRLSEAEQYALESLRALRAASGHIRAVGPEKPMEALCEVYRLQGRMPEAVAVAREAVALGSVQPQDGDYGRITNEWRDKLIYLLTTTRQLQEAESVAREQIDTLRRIRGGTHPTTLRALNGLAWSLVEAGRFAEAEPLAQEAVAGYRLAAVQDVLDRLNATDTLAVTLCKLDRPSEAEPLFREIFELLASGPPARMFNGDAGLHALHYGECLMMLRRYTEAEVQLLNAREAAEEFQSIEEARRTSGAARDRLVALYEAIGMPEKAAEFRPLTDADARSSLGYEP